MEDFPWLTQWVRNWMTTSDQYGWTQPSDLERDGCSLVFNSLSFRLLTDGRVKKRSVMSLLRFQSLFTFWLDSQLLGCFSSFCVWHWSSLFRHVAWKQRQWKEQWQLIKRSRNLKDFYYKWKRYSKRQWWRRALWRSTFLHYLRSWSWNVVIGGPSAWPPRHFHDCLL